MGQIKITINTDNAAFQDGNLCAEISDILENLIDNMNFSGMDDEYQFTLHDTNGNTVGLATYNNEEN